MKKIIFVGEFMLCGGVEKSLISLLNYLDPYDYSVTLLLLKKRGVLMSQIPEYVNVIEMDLPLNEEFDILYGKSNALKRAFKEKKYFQFVKKVVRGIYLNLISRSDEEKRVNYYRMLDKKFAYINENYDLAIDYMGYGLLNTFFVAKKINARKKLTWIHFDPKIGMSDFKALQYYLRYYDQIITVSKEIFNQTSIIIPEMVDKLKVFYNIINKEDIYKQATLENVFDDDYEGERILSVGRLDLSKGFDIAIPIIRKLLDEQYNIKWYIIGEGNLRDELESLIIKYNLQDYIILLGQKINPYPYMSKCDYYFQPSRHEGYGIAVAEARAFCKPMVVTDFAGAKEQLRNNTTGLIVKCNENELYNGLKTLLDNCALCDKLNSNLRKELSTAESIRKEINQLFDE